MFHAIEFAGDIVLDLEISRRHPLERIRVACGTRLHAQLRPYVIEADEGPIEVADLYFEDGTVGRTVRFAAFAFVD